MSDLAAPNGNGHTGTTKPEIVATYNYTDEQGTLLYQAVRYRPKDFKQRKPAAGGGWEWKVGNVRRVPYGLPELISANPGEWVYVVEGEKDVDRLRGLGLVSTTNVGGAGKWLSEYSTHLRDRRVVVLPDNDEPGRKHAAQVAASLQGIASEVRVVDLPGLPPKGDVSDWLSTGGMIEDLLRLVDQAPPWTPAATANGLQSDAPAAVSFPDQAEEAVLDQPIREPAPWPTLDDAAYHGLAGEIVRTIEPETEADPVAILAQLFVSFGNMVGRDAYYVVEGTQHHTNLFAVLVGSTARGRKGTSEGRVKQVLRAVDEPWVLSNIKTGCVSGEGLIWNVRDPIYKVENVKDKGRIVGTEEVLADPGIEDKRLLIIEPEFASVLRVCRREQNTLSPTLRSAWDSGILRTLAKNSPAVATDAHVSFCGHITSEELHRALAEVDGFNGFANRFLWVAVRRSKLLPDGGRDLDLTLLAQRLALAAEQARSVGRMYRDQAATALWRRAYAELADDNAGGLLGAVTSRAEAQVLRLSMIYALLDGTGTISDRHLLAALALWRYCRSSAAMIFSGMGADPVEDQILAKIKAAPGISRKELHRVLGGHTKAAVLNTILARLRDAGRLRVERIETATKPAERWYPCEQCELSEQFSTVGGNSAPQPGDSSESSESSQHSTDNSTGTSTAPDEPEIEEYEPTYCRGCRKLLVDQAATVVAEFHWMVGLGGGDYCRECYEAGRVEESTTGRRTKWHGPDYKIGTSLADDTEPAVTDCNHKDPETWVSRDGKAYCAKCDKYMGRLRT